MERGERAIATEILRTSEIWRRNWQAQIAMCDAYIRKRQGEKRKERSEELKVGEREVEERERKQEKILRTSEVWRRSWKAQIAKRGADIETQRETRKEGEKSEREVDEKSESKRKF